MAPTSTSALVRAARGRRGRSWWTLAVMLTLCVPAWATCTRISYAPGVAYASNSIYYVDPAHGTHNIWSGSLDTAGASGLSVSSVNLNSSTFQPDGTLLASGSASFLTLGNEAYTAEQVLFRCDAADEGSLFEFYATNGDNDYGGRYEDGASFGLPGAYRTYIRDMVIRVTHTLTGNYFSRYWQSRPLTNLDRDGQGKILVKAKNFSDVRVELFRVSNTYGSAGSGLYGYSQPAAYIAFKGPGWSNNLLDGRDSGSYFDGWYAAWPGTINLYNRLTVRRSATCAVTNVTPNVRFPLMTVAELQGGGTRQMPIDITFECQTGAPANTGLAALASGVNAGQTAMGVLVPAANFQSAAAQGLTTAGSGATFLLSDGYGTDPGVATGVGVSLALANGTPLNFLGNAMVTGSGNAAGWYPVLDGATATGVAAGVTNYTKRLQATLKRIPGRTVTPGKINARAQVVIRVQ
ncbi:fimbrial protein [Variovorax sp. YR216]|uniref:fimbrial protein n=1 Tax=Variovorax sp. YR216 TaxID=1882828 RepID=UPI00089CAF81|nr:fimbrial protein [Variovorax sp. YR216]SEA02084.1 Fimbrial protein [Variovorax sp. YR216]